MSEWIDRQLEQFTNHSLPWGSRLRAVVEELANYKDSLASYGTTVPSDPPGEAHTKRYLLALGKVKDELIAEGTGLNYEDEIVYWAVHAAVDKEGPGKSSTPVDLVALYREFKGKYFNDAVPTCQTPLFAALCDSPSMRRGFATWKRTHQD